VPEPYDPGVWELFPLKGFAPLPGPGRLDPYNLGVNWPLEPQSWPEAWDSSRDLDWLAVRVGGWATVSRSGSSTKVGEWQSTQSSPFVDIDGLYSDGTRTVNFFATNLDNDTRQAEFQYFGPDLRATVDAQTFIHRLIHDPLSNDPSGRPLVSAGVFKQDLNVGDNFALRVEEVKGEAVTDLTDNIKLRVQFFEMRKFGERQENAVAHCFALGGVAGRNCHLLSQSQHVDWTTMEVTPRLEGHFGPATIEYSRLMRQFSSNDQSLFRDYNGVGGLLQGNLPYAVVPDVTTQMDQLRLNLDLARQTKFYGFGYAGHMDDSYRDIVRDLYGFDTRLTDRSLDKVLFTLYARGRYQNGNTPAALLPDELLNLTLPNALLRIREPIADYQTTGGFRTRYTPDIGVPLFSHLAFTGGYEYDVLTRTHATYANPVNPPISFTQPTTISNTFHVGVQQPWTDTVDTFARYQLAFISDPLFGFRQTSGVTNTSLPHEEHVIEVGGGWYPVANFGVNITQEINLSFQRSDISQVPGNFIRFDEQSYATTLTAWYAPTAKLSLMSSFALMSNWINQNITLGDDYIQPETTQTNLLPPTTRPWFYGGRNAVITARADYRFSPQFRVHAGYEFVHGLNSIDNRGFADLWPDLGTFSQVFVETHRVQAGADWKPAEHLTLYARYEYYLYNDYRSPQNDGNLHMVLGGLNLIW
jgi:hypothetical protein